MVRRPGLCYFATLLLWSVSLPKKTPPPGNGVTCPGLNEHEALPIPRPQIAHLHETAASSTSSAARGSGSRPASASHFTFSHLPPPLRCDLFAPNVHTAANIANPPSPRAALGFIPPIALLIQPPKPSQLHLHFLCPQSSPKAISNLGHNSATGTFISYHLQPSRE